MNSAATHSLNPQDEALLELARAVRASDYTFTTVTPLTHARVNSRIGNEIARDLRGVFGWSRPFSGGVVAQAWMELMERANVLVAHADGWQSRVRFSTLQGQLFVHSAYPTGDADSVFFGPDTYRFAAAIQRHIEARVDAPSRIVDIGCGAGPGAIIAALDYPEAEVFAADINHGALRFAGINARLAGCAKVVACHSDLLSGVEGEFDLILANPPYLVDPAERAYRHGGGLLGAGLSLDIVDAASKRLSSRGSLLLYTGVAIVDGVDLFHEAVVQKLKSQAVVWSYEEIDPDVFGEELQTEAYSETERIAAIVLTVTRLSE